MNPNHRMFILEQKNELNERVGWVEIDKTVNCLEFIAVEPEHRKQGVAVQLLEKVFDWMKTNKIKFLEFQNINWPFWQSVANRWPNKIVLLQNGEGKIFV